MPWLRGLVANLSPRSPGFAPRSVHMRFVVDKVAPGEILRFIRFPPVNIIPPWLSIFMYNLKDEQRPVSGRGSRSLTHSIDMKNNNKGPCPNPCSSVMHLNPAHYMQNWKTAYWQNEFWQDKTTVKCKSKEGPKQCEYIDPSFPTGQHRPSGNDDGGQWLWLKPWKYCTQTDVSERCMLVPGQWQLMNTQLLLRLETQTVIRIILIEWFKIFMQRTVRELVMIAVGAVIDLLARAAIRCIARITIYVSFNSFPLTDKTPTFLLIFIFLYTL
jgi:hypothetical protein